ncbi:MAG: hypothetical protein AABM29_02815 [Actinomycetota bacterium]
MGALRRLSSLLRLTAGRGCFLLRLAECPFRLPLLLRKLPLYHPLPRRGFLGAFVTVVIAAADGADRGEQDRSKTGDDDARTRGPHCFTSGSEYP